MIKQQAIIGDLVLEGACAMVIRLFSYQNYLLGRVYVVSSAFSLTFDLFLPFRLINRAFVVLFYRLWYIVNGSYSKGFMNIANLAALVSGAGPDVNSWSGRTRRNSCCKKVL
jgi:hypothetical protein